MWKNLVKNIFGTRHEREVKRMTPIVAQINEVCERLQSVSEEELKRAYFSLQDAGVPIHRAVDHGSQKSIYFHDPDNNLLEIVWERPDTREIFARGGGSFCWRRWALERLAAARRGGRTFYL